MNPDPKIQFGKRIPPSAKREMGDRFNIQHTARPQPKPKTDFSYVAGKTIDAATKLISNVAKDFVHAVGPANIAGLILIACTAGVGFYYMKEKVQEVMNFQIGK